MARERERVTYAWAAGVHLRIFEAMGLISKRGTLQLSRENES